MIDLDELIFVDEDEWATLPETFGEGIFSNDEDVADFPPEDTEEAENLRYREMLSRLDELAWAYQWAGDTDGEETD